MKLEDLTTHTEAQIDAALERGEEVWHLDTGGDDSNDFYIGSRTAVVDEVLLRHCPTQRTWPQRWALKRVLPNTWAALVRANDDH